MQILKMHSFSVGTFGATYQNYKEMCAINLHSFQRGGHTSIASRRRMSFLRLGVVKQHKIPNSIASQSGNILYND